MALKNNNEYTKKIIAAIGKKLDVDLSKYDMDEMVKGMEVELEHGSVDNQTDVTSDDPAATFQIMLAHLNELPDYYTRLDKMEKEGKKAAGQSDEETEEPEKREKEDVTESFSNRFKELCGVKENAYKKQLTNEYFHSVKKPIIQESEVVDKPNVLQEGTFNKFEFENDGVGDDENNSDLYKMDKMDKKKTIGLALEDDVTKEKDDKQKKGFVAIKVDGTTIREDAYFDENGKLIYIDQELHEPSSALFKWVEKQFFDWLEQQDKDTQAMYDEDQTGTGHTFADQKGAIEDGIDLLFDVMKENNVKYLDLNKIPVNIDMQLDWDAVFRP